MAWYYTVSGGNMGIALACGAVEPTQAGGGFEVLEE